MENENQTPSAGDKNKNLASGGDDVEKNRVLAAVSYLWIVSVIALLVQKDSKFVKFHASQGLVLFVASVICSFIPVVGWILNVLILILVIMGLVKALNREWWKIPAVYDIAKSIFKLEVK